LPDKKYGFTIFSKQKAFFVSGAKDATGCAWTLFFGVPAHFGGVPEK
jgi:hypothetical protein